MVLLSSKVNHMPHPQCVTIYAQPTVCPIKCLTACALIRSKWLGQFFIKLSGNLVLTQDVAAILTKLANFLCLPQDLIKPHSLCIGGVDPSLPNRNKYAGNLAKGALVIPVFSALYSLLILFSVAAKKAIWFIEDRYLQHAFQTKVDNRDHFQQLDHFCLLETHFFSVMFFDHVPTTVLESQQFVPHFIVIHVRASDFSKFNNWQ